MRKILILSLLPCFSGCAYLHDRGRDACDMVTLSVEATGLNASVQMGPAVLGAGLAHGKGVGLRSGAMGAYEFGEVNLGIFGGKYLVPGERDLDREKGYVSFYRFFPWIDGEDDDDRFDRELREGKSSWDDDEDENPFDMEVKEGEWFNAFNIECSVMAGLGARAGINIAEIMDFVLGWTTLDICGDDIATSEEKEQREFRRRKGADNLPDAGDGL